jgi:hypothetical protein
MKKGVDYIGVTVVFACHDGEGNYLFAKRGKNCLLIDCDTIGSI